ncbi:MAG TPA: hypothetical protein VJR30_24565 [Bradyrhizobium sp.]|nr:hypothetical protein [Bradyrhizobium sp.]
MIASEILAKGVERGIITPEQAERLRALENAGAPPELPVSPDDEQLRLIGGFSDIFVTIGLAMFLGAAGYLARLAGGTIGLWAVVAIAAWLFAEFFTRRRRMALPSIVLLIVFAWAVFAGTAIALWTNTEPPTNYRPSPGGLFGVSMFNPAVQAISACVTVVLTALHYWRFRVPMTIAAGCGALVVATVALANGLAPGLSRGAQDAIIFVCGLAIFGLAMRFDMADPARLTRRTDIAFWLHLLAAPLIVHSLIDGAFDTGSKLDPGSAVAIVALFLALGVVAILIDRRALLVSGLAYAGVAFWALIRQAGVTGVTTPLTILALGTLVLLLSAAWKPLRAGVVRLAPSVLTRRLPQPTLSA